ncbi:hypothetical protein LZ32DRAFT_58746 [Colletotrichum eremochloae]|nr:hypothetical protein LZ32DRAFT_58746 [Colletotrichum eremochloae]
MRTASPLGFCDFFPSVLFSLGVRWQPALCLAFGAMRRAEKGGKEIRVLRYCTTHRLIYTSPYFTCQYQWTSGNPTSELSSSAGRSRCNLCRDTDCRDGSCCCPCLIGGVCCQEPRRRW